MSRPLRIEYPDAVYHVMSRGSEKKTVFRDDQDRVNFLNTLQYVNTIWTEVRGQTILGEEGFVDKPVDHIKKRKDILEIPRIRRYAHRPSLDKLFGKEVRLNLRRRREAIVKAVEQYGYRQQEAASHLGLHYSSISRIMKGGR